MKMIPVNSCTKCPNLDHKGAFGFVAYVPVCRFANRTLPHWSKMNESGRAYAELIDQIPDWCPLEDAYPKHDCLPLIEVVELEADQPQINLLY